MTWKSVLLRAVPGLCHIHHERTGRGLARFAAFVLAFNLRLAAAWDGSRCVARRARAPAGKPVEPVESRK